MGIINEALNQNPVHQAVYAIISGAVSHVECMFPPDAYTVEEWEEFVKSGGLQELLGNLESIVGWQLSVLYASLTQDGMGVGDAVETIGFDDFMHRFCEETVEYRKKPLKSGQLLYPRRFDTEIKKMVNKFSEIITDEMD